MDGLRSIRRRDERPLPQAENEREARLTIDKSVALLCKDPAGGGAQMMGREPGRDSYPNLRTRRLRKTHSVAGNHRIGYGDIVRLGEGSFEHASDALEGGYVSLRERNSHEEDDG